MKTIPQRILLIGNDHISGSSEICMKLANVMKNEIISIDNGEKLKAFLSYIEKYIIAAHPDMVILLAFFKNLKLSKKISVDNLLSSIDEFIKTMVDAPVVIASKLRSKFKKIKVLMTYSASSIVEKVIKELKKEGFLFEVIVCESRPLCEGKRLAKRLVKANISTILATDAAAFSNILRVDALITGADMVGHDFFRNKIGTKAFFELGSLHDTDNYVLCERSKITKKRLKENIKLGWEYEKQNKFGIIKACFENIPLSQVTKIITD